jgi:hypothetical protein
VRLAAPSLANFALRNHWSLMLAGVLIIPLVVFITTYHWINRRRWEASQKWPAVTGYVTKVDDQVHDDDTYSLKIHYAFVVAGAQYTASRQGFGTGVTAANSEELKLRMAEWPVGKAVTIYYDPAHPYNAALERTRLQTREDKFWSIALFGLLVLYAAALDFGMIRFDN